MNYGKIKEKLSSNGTNHFVFFVEKNFFFINLTEFIFLYSLWIIIIKGQVNLPAKILMEKVYYGKENMPSWNPTLMESKILKVKQLISPMLFRQKWL